MKLLNVRVFEGRNIYAHRKCIRLDVDLEGYCETPSKDIKDFNNKLLEMLPELKTHRCGIYEEGGFVTRLGEGTYLAHICEHIIIALQNRIGIDSSFGKARVIDGDLYYIIFEYKYEKTALKCAKLAIDIVNYLTGMEIVLNINDRLDEINTVLAGEEIGPSTGAICEMAKKMGIPVIKLGDTGLYQLGTGKYGKVIEATISSNTSAIGVDISCDKLMTKAILDKQYLPVLPGYKIKNTVEALYYGEKLGYPLVIKPQCGNQGKGVIVDIRNKIELVRSFDKLKKSYEDIIIEKYIKGNDYRVCVVDGEVVAVALRVPPFIVGDGKKSIKALIDEINNDPRRGCNHEKPLTKIAVDDNLLHRLNGLGYSMDSVLPEKVKLYLRGNANLSTGGSALDYTDKICEENKEICRRAACTVGLDICGIDICCEDIGVPINGNGAIIEINAAPGIRMHHFPSNGKSRNVAKAIVEMMFKEGKSSVPVISVTGTNGKTTTTRLIGHVLSCAGYKVGMTTTGGVYINNRCIEKGDTTGYESAMSVLLNKDVEVAVLETARGGIIKHGLAYDMADVGVITNITEDHLGLDGLKDLKDLANVKSLVVEAVKDEGYSVINGDDPISLTIIDRIKSNLIIFSKDENNPYLRHNLEKGGIGIYLKEENIYYQKCNEIIKIVSLKNIPITLRGKVRFNIENSMSAAAALLALGVAPRIISKGFTSFYGDEENNPGRFNIFNLDGISIILDYGHNKDGYRAVGETLMKMKHKRLVGIIGVPGDRLNSDIIEVGRIAGKSFDKIYIKEDDDKRGRGKGEVAELLKLGVTQSGRIDENDIEILDNEREALIRAIDSAKYGDTIMVFLEKYEPLLQIVKERIECASQKQIVMA